LGVDGAFVDALLGHSGVAGEAHGHFSAIAPEDMRRAVEEPLEHLYREIPLRPIFL
jgi:hypothetical protein